MRLCRVLLVIGGLLTAIQAIPLVLILSAPNYDDRVAATWLLPALVSLGIVAGGHALARRGRTTAAALLLMILVVPGVLLLGAVAFTLGVLLGPRH